MRYNSTKNLFFTAAFAAMILIMAAGAVIAIIAFTGAAQWAFPIFYAVIAALAVWLYFSAYYMFGDDALAIRGGAFRDRVPYDAVRGAAKCRSYAFALALSTERIQLTYGDGAHTLTMMISPEREDEFLAELKKRCPNLEIKE